MRTVAIVPLVILGALALVTLGALASALSLFLLTLLDSLNR